MSVEDGRGLDALLDVWLCAFGGWALTIFCLDVWWAEVAAVIVGGLIGWFTRRRRRRYNVHGDEHEEKDQGIGPRTQT